MKSSYTVKILLAAIIIAVFGLIACKSKTAKDPHAAHRQEMVVDSSLAILTKPVNEQVIAAIPAITAESGTRIFSSEVNGVITYDTRNQVSIASRIGGRI